MLNCSNLLILAGSLCMVLALVLAWCLVGVRSSSFMKSIFPSYQYLFEGPHRLPDDVRVVDCFYVVCPLSLVRATSHRSIDDHRIINEPRWLPGAGGKAQDEPTPGQPIRRRHGLQLHPDDGWLRWCSVVRRACSSPGAVTFSQSRPETPL